jgi:hypothetical protein
MSGFCCFSVCEERCLARKSAAYKDRLGYLHQHSRRLILNQSLPVFAGAGLTFAVAGIIEALTEDKSLVLGLLGTYSLTAYTTGKWCSYRLLDERESWDWMLTLIRLNRLSPILLDCLGEISGFANKEFFVRLSLTLIFERRGINAALGAWFMILAVALLSIRAFMYVHRVWFRVDEELSFKLSLFEIKAFKLTLAYVLTVLMLLSIAVTWGVDVLQKDSFLLEWQEDSTVGAGEFANGPLSLGYGLLFPMFAALLQNSETNKEEEYISEYMEQMHLEEVQPPQPHWFGDRADTHNPLVGDSLGPAPSHSSVSVVSLLGKGSGNLSHARQDGTWALSARVCVGRVSGAMAVALGRVRRALGISDDEIKLWFFLYNDTLG